MNVAELRAAFRRDADDRAEPFLWPDEDILDWLNEAQREACVRARLLFRRDTLTVSQGEAVLALPPGWFEIRFAALREGGTFRQILCQYDAWEQDRLRPYWRTESRCPDGFVCRDGELELNALPDRDYVLFLEGYCFPPALHADGDEPGIEAVHHPELLHWALFRACSVPDKEMFDAGRAAEHEARFEHYFGRKPGAALRRPQSANNPHHNKCWW